MAVEDALPSLKRLLKALIDSRNPFYSRKLGDAGFTNFDEMDLDDFRQRCPFTTKDELARDHQVNPPFGSNLGKPVGNYSRVCKTSGTTGERMMWPDTPSGWDGMLEVWKKIYLMAGVKPGADRVYYAFSFGPFIGFWTAFEAALKMGCMVFPGGGSRSSERVDEIVAGGATVLCCTPTYAQRLGQVMSSGGYTHNIGKVIVAGEPGGSIPEVREKISSLWGNAQVFDHHGMTEVGPVSVEPPGKPGNLCMVPGFHFAEVLHLETGSEVDAGEKGELVLTTLRRDDSPVLRYRTGDLVCKSYYDVDGERVIGFEGGILGRIDDMVVVRGVNLYPSAIDAVVCRFADIDNYQVVITSERSMSEAILKVELNPRCRLNATLEKISDALRSAFALRIPVESVPLGTLPVNEFKANRWIKQ